jgi:hypothetical protein
MFYYNRPGSLFIKKVCKTKTEAFRQNTYFLKYAWVGNCDIDFLNFRHCQVQNFKISNLSKWNQNFAANFWKHRSSSGGGTNPGPFFHLHYLDLPLSYSVLFHFINWKLFLKKQFFDIVIFLKTGLYVV